MPGLLRLESKADLMHTYCIRHKPSTLAEMTQDFGTQVFAGRPLQGECMLQVLLS